MCVGGLMALQEGMFVFRDLFLYDRNNKKPDLALFRPNQLIFMAPRRRMKQPALRAWLLMNRLAEWITTPDNTADRDSPLSIGGVGGVGGKKNRIRNEEINQRETVMIMEAG